MSHPALFGAGVVTDVRCRDGVAHLPEPRPQTVTQEPELRCQASTGIAKELDGPSSNPDWLPKIEKGTRNPLLTWTFWSGRPDLNRRPLDPQARIRCLAWSEGSNGEPLTCGDVPEASRWAGTSLST
jgi:hypothetical protein